MALINQHKNFIITKTKSTFLIKKTRAITHFTKCEKLKKTIQDEKVMRRILFTQ